MLIASNFLVPGPTFVVELVIFLAVLGVLAKWVLPPINGFMEARQDAIARELREADEAKKRAAELEKNHQQILEQGRAEAQQLKEEAAKVGEQLRQQLHQKGEEEYNRLLARATADIEASARRAGEELRAQVSGLVMDVVQRVLGEGITLADQARLVDQAIAELEAQTVSPTAGQPAWPGAAPLGSSR